jgi:hypothetical protein
MPSPILILLPSLNRNAALLECLDCLLKTSSGLADVLTIGGNGGSVKALNGVPASLLCQYEIIGLMGDDIRVRTNHWDRLVFDRLHDKTGLIYGRDGIQDQRLCTHPFFSSEIVLATGYIHPPELHHFFGDNFFMDLLTPLGLIQFVPELFTEHLHCQTGRSPIDQTHITENARVDSDRRAYDAYRNSRLQSDIVKVRSLMK